MALQGNRKCDEYNECRGVASVLYCNPAKGGRLQSVARKQKRDKRTVGSIHISNSRRDMYRADGTLTKVPVTYNGLKPVVIK